MKSLLVTILLTISFPVNDYKYDMWIVDNFCGELINSEYKIKPCK